MIINIAEKAIENQILSWLTKKKIFCWKIQKIGVYDKSSGSFRKSYNAFHINGIPDINGILPGSRPLYIEVKKPYVSKKTFTIKKKSQDELEKMASSDQADFIKRAKELGAVAFYADSLDVVIEQFSLYGLEF